MDLPADRRIPIEIAQVATSLPALSRANLSVTPPQSSLNPLPTLRTASPVTLPPTPTMFHTDLGRRIPQSQPNGPLSESDLTPSFRASVTHAFAWEGVVGPASKPKFCYNRLMKAQRLGMPKRIPFSIPRSTIQNALGSVSTQSKKSAGQSFVLKPTASPVSDAQSQN